MKVIVNGKEVELDANQTVQELLVQLGHEGARVAVALNKEFLPRNDHSTTIVQDGDDLEIVAPMQGG